GSWSSRWWLTDSLTVSRMPSRSTHGRSLSGERGRTTPLVQRTRCVQRGCSRARRTKSQNCGWTVGSPPSSCTWNGPSGGKQAVYCSSDNQVLPRGDEQVLHQGQARLQWFVRAT